MSDFTEFDKVLLEVLPPQMYGKQGLDGISRSFDNNARKRERLRAAAEAAVQVDGNTSDGYHTFNELYEFRKLYNAAFFNLIARIPQARVHKSRLHSDGTEPFGGGWFIVMATLPTGQISNHYELADWDLFKIPEHETADEYDGHTPDDVRGRLYAYLDGSKPFNNKGE
jgi:hypothetical protein